MVAIFVAWKLTSMLRLTVAFELLC
jgi:hypothetical protein